MLLVCLFVSVALAGIPAPHDPFGDLLKQHGVSPHINGKRHVLHFDHSDHVGKISLHYDATLSDKVVQLEELPIESSTCEEEYFTVSVHNVHHSKFTIGSIVTGHEGYGCTHEDGSPRSVMRKVVSITSSGSTLRLGTVATSFHEVFTDANIAFTTNKVPPSRPQSNKRKEPKPKIVEAVNEDSHAEVKRGTSQSFMSGLWNSVTGLGQEVTNLAVDAYNLGASLASGEVNLNQQTWTLAQMTLNFDPTTKLAVQSWAVSDGFSCDSCWIFGEFDVSFQLTISGGQLVSFEVLRIGRLQTSVGGTFKTSVSLAGTYKFPAVNLPPIIFAIAGVPVYISNKFAWSLGFQASSSASYATGVTAYTIGTLSSGLRYANGQISLVKDYNYTHQANRAGNSLGLGPASQVSAQGSLTGAVSMTVDDVLGFSIGIKPYVELVLDSTYGAIKPNCAIGFAANLGFQASISASIQIELATAVIYSYTFATVYFINVKKPLVTRCFSSKRQVSSDLSVVPGSTYLATWTNLAGTGCPDIPDVEFSMQMLDLFNDTSNSLAGATVYGTVDADDGNGLSCLSQVSYDLVVDQGTQYVSFTPSGYGIGNVCEGGATAYPYQFWGTGTLDSMDLVDLTTGCYSVHLQLYEPPAIQEAKVGFSTAALTSDRLVVSQSFLVVVLVVCLSILMA